MHQVSRFLTVIAAALLMMLGCTASARAALYAYSYQQTGNYSITGATAGTINANSQSSAAQTAIPSGSDAHSGLFDVLQSYVGPGAGKPPENQFTAKGQTTPDYSRGDAFVTSSGFGTNNVAELFLTNPGDAAASGGWSVSIPLTVLQSGAVSVGFDYANNLTVNHSGSPAGTVQGNFSYTLGIRDASGASVFTASPSVLNRNASLTSAGSIVDAGSGSVLLTSPTLPAGAYTLTLSGTENVLANLVPEPVSSLAGLGLSWTILIRPHRRRRRTEP